MVHNGKEADVNHPLSFEKADRELCFNRIDRKFRMPDSNMHFQKLIQVSTKRAGKRNPLRCNAGRTGRYKTLGVQ